MFPPASDFLFGTRRDGIFQADPFPIGRGE
jgi:hypothetical protein